MENLTNAVAFLRIADKRQLRHKNSLHYQLDLIEQYAKKSNTKIKAVFENVNKKDMDFYIGEMYGYCQENPEVKEILVTRFDRLGRNAERYYYWKKQFNILGINVKAVCQPTEDTFLGQYMENQYVLLSHLDSCIRSQRTRENMRKKAEAGYLMYAPPLGYERTNVTGVYQPNRFGQTLGSVMSELAMEVSPKKLKDVLLEIYESYVGRIPTKIELRRWVTNPYYVGQVKYAGKTYQGRHKALFSQETQQRIQKALS